ncbi:hypothetical protein [Shewanella sp. NIFS-20-20]|uniref:hypothetical protein n=1 Tax=Shewanella sp. NIFS-20-20 TaxID=2853806 RepID=UPI001C46F91B|nr:hypothetical protein [Shewanella sp. NIFS-20-20]MBV7316298.1 hypothetical protein [Shewanella sp. NIFS-20-20]
MKYVLFLALCLPFMTMAKGNSSFNSEISHVAGGAVMAGAVVALSDHYWPQYNRAWVGFGVSALIGTLAELNQYSRNENSIEEALLDATSHALGSAIGAYLTDQYILSPVIKPDIKQGTFVGVQASFRF